MKTKTPTTPKKPELLKPVEGRNMGKNYGFQYIDGNFYLCDALADPMKEIVNEQAAIKDLISHIMDHANNRLTILQKRHSEWFARVADDLGDYLTPDERTRLKYFHSEKRISIVEKKEPNS